MPNTTRTLNPLHFEDLEPHRFEDLVRQIAYDFRPWKSIEATGRLGADEGTDVRAIEAAGIELEDTIGGQDQDQIALPEHGERVWVIQCKREKSITPKRMRKIVDDSVPVGGDVPHGFILAAACDFSKKARDVCQSALRARGVQEFYIWGKAELEDMLFFPKYDHLLFAYFNISIQVRRRSLKSELRSRLTLKRQVVKVLGDVREEHFKPVLLRDPREEHYPYADRIADFAAQPRWWYYTFVSHNPPDHLSFVAHRYFAYVDDEGMKWDALFDFDCAIPGYPEIRYMEDAWEEEREKDGRYRAYWNENVPEKNRAWFTVLRCVHYDRILAVDEHGDSHHEGPHILVDFNNEHGPFEPNRKLEYVEFGPTYFRRILLPTEENRITFFPKQLPFLEEARDVGK